MTKIDPQLFRVLCGYVWNSHCPCPLALANVVAYLILLATIAQCVPRQGLSALQGVNKRFRAGHGLETIGDRCWRVDFSRHHHGVTSPAPRGQGLRSDGVALRQAR